METRKSSDAPALAEAFGNHRYHGRAFGWIFLAVLGAMNLFRGSIHLLKSDGGAASIAGIDMTLNGGVILSLFAAMGFGQLIMAAIDFAVAFRYRAFARYVLAYHFVQVLGASIIVWWWRPMPLPDAPGKPGQLLMIPLIAIALWAATRENREERVVGEMEPAGR